MKSEKDRRPSPASSIRTTLQKEQTVKRTCGWLLQRHVNTAAVPSEAWSRTVVEFIPAAALEQLLTSISQLRSTHPQAGPPLDLSRVLLAGSRLSSWWRGCRSQAGALAPTGRFRSTPGVCSDPLMRLWWWVSSAWRWIRAEGGGGEPADDYWLQDSQSASRVHRREDLASREPCREGCQTSHDSVLLQHRRERPPILNRFLFWEQPFESSRGRCKDTDPLSSSQELQEGGLLHQRTPPLHRRTHLNHRPSWT